MEDEIVSWMTVANSDDIHGFALLIAVCFFVSSTG